MPEQKQKTFPKKTKNNPSVTKEGSFMLSVQPAMTPSQVSQKKREDSKQENPKKPSIVNFKAAQQKDTSLLTNTTNIKGKFSSKTWNALEWLATSAFIFMLIFFALNFQVYSDLFINKLDQMRGKVVVNPYLQDLTANHGASESQQPLKVLDNPQQSKKQIPPLDIAIAPPDDRVIIPRINRNVPIVKVSSENLLKRNWGALEADIQEALRDGVVHYPGTAYPNQQGNVVITGHSSYFPWDPGRFKDVFAALHKVVVGDKIIVYYQQKKYIYEVYEIKDVTPDKVEVLNTTEENRLTLITCTPVGTNLRRLVVIAKPVVETIKN